MSLCFLPFNILTATVLQVAVLSIPKASASITWPKAPRPRGFPGTDDNGNYKIWLSHHTTRGLCEDSDWLKGRCIPFRPTFRFTPSVWLSPCTFQSALLWMVIQVPHYQKAIRVITQNQEIQFIFTNKNTSSE